MAKFKYRFESIKEIKKRYEKKVQKEVAVIDLEIKKREQQIIELHEKSKNEKIKILEKGTKKVSELHFFSMYDNYIMNEIDNVKQEIEIKKIEKEKKIIELAEKTKETKIFEKLEEKHFEEFKIEENKKEQLELDEIAVTKFIKGK
ncbi:MAG: flagellar export protein FliJ [Melioribacteraceae bacterium]